MKSRGFERSQMTERMAELNNLQRSPFPTRVPWAVDLFRCILTINRPTKFSYVNNCSVNLFQ